VVSFSTCSPFSLPPLTAFSFSGPTVININIIISGACRASPRIIPVDAAAWGEGEVVSKEVGEEEEEEEKEEEGLFKAELSLS
jgi:hypothetical protein